MSARRLCYAVLLSSGLALRAQETAPPVRFEAELSRTAVWKGDEFHYLVTLLHQPDIEIIRDNLRGESLNLEPFTLSGLHVESGSTGASGGIVRLQFDLALLDASGSEAAIPPLTIYYATRRPGPLGKGTEVETHTLVIPEKVVGVRTTLTSGSRDIRDAVTVPGAVGGGGAIAAVGWGVLALLLVQAGRWGFAYYRERAQAGPRRDRRDVERNALKRLDELELTAGQEGMIAGHCQELAKVVQETLTALNGIQAANFTPEELKEELVKTNAGEPLVEQVYQLLRTCEDAGYRQPGPVDGRSSAGDLIRSSRAIVSQLSRL